jgi:hypothetical protein
MLTSSFDDLRRKKGSGVMNLAWQEWSPQSLNIRSNESRPFFASDPAFPAGTNPSCLEGGKMQIDNWKEFYDSLSIEPASSHLLHAPTPSDLDAYEAKAGFKLPRSYREFVLQFGPGDFSSCLLIAAPGYTEAQSTFDLQTANSRFGYQPDDLARNGYSAEKRELLCRLVYFGLAHGEDWLGWDTQAVRNPDANEYAIYQVDWRRDQLRFVADSFRQLIGDLCDEIFAPDPDYDESTMGPQRVFRRFTLSLR